MKGGGKPGDRLAGTGRGLTGAGESIEKAGEPLAGPNEGFAADGGATENAGELICKPGGCSAGTGKPLQRPGGRLAGISTPPQKVWRWIEDPIHSALPSRGLTTGSSLLTMEPQPNPPGNSAAPGTQRQAVLIVSMPGL
jgi:hypothetical protein